MTFTIRALIESAWRRRFLILVPFIALTLAGLVAALMWPKLYASKTLMLLQEDGGSNPLARPAEIVLDQRARIAALEALVKSDRVLRAVLTDTLGDAVADPATMAFEMRELRGDIFVRLIGDQFVEIELFGSSPERAQALLRALVGRTLESLLLPANAMPSGPDFLIAQRRTEIAVYEAASAELEEQAGGLTPEALSRKISARISASEDLARARAETSRARAALAARLTAVLGPSDAPRSVSGALAAIETQLAAEGDVAPSADERAALESRATALRGLLPDENRLRDVIAEETRARQALAEATAAVSEHEALRAERDELTRRFQEASAEIDGYLERFRTQRAQTLNLLRAPEQIRIVDEPILPKAPSTSALKILIAGVVAGVGLGVGLAIAAEQLDQSVRGAEDVADAAQAPVIARVAQVAARRVAAVGAPREGPPPATAAA